MLDPTAVFAGLCLGAVAGLAMHALYTWVVRSILAALLGRKEGENGKPSERKIFAALLLSNIAAILVVSLLLLGTTMPFQAIIEAWQPFVLSWAFGLAAGSLYKSIRGRKATAKK